MNSPKAGVRFRTSRSTIYCATNYTTSGVFSTSGWIRTNITSVFVAPDSSN
ncbi:MAG: hypothetical protein IKF79_05670 [Methanosphaera sp.]|nr:hypothetical protein [Methanosphaera sp.]